MNIKKVGFILILFLLVSVAWDYYALVRPEAISKADFQIEKIEIADDKFALEKKIEKKHVAPQLILPGDTDDNKMQRALQNIQKKSRIPTGALKINPEKLFEHEAFKGSRWRVWSGVKALLVEDVRASDVVVSQLGRFSLIENLHEEASLKQFDRKSPTVVYDSRLKSPGLLTGLIKVETDRVDLLQMAIQDLNAHVENSFEHIQTYFVTSRQTQFDLEKLYFFIRALPFVKNAELDILDRDYEKK